MSKTLGKFYDFEMGNPKSHLDNKKNKIYQANRVVPYNTIDGKHAFQKICSLLSEK